MNQYKVTDLKGRTWAYPNRQVAMDAGRRHGGTVTGPMMHFSSPGVAPELAGPITLNEEQRMAATWLAYRYAHELLGMDAGLPDKHSEGQHYNDKNQGEISYARGVGAGLPGKQANVQNVGSPTGAFLTKNLKEEEDDKHAVDSDVTGGLADGYIQGASQKTQAPKKPPGAGCKVDYSGTDQEPLGVGGPPQQQRMQPPGAPVKAGGPPNGAARQQPPGAPMAKPKPQLQRPGQVEQHLDDQENGHNQQADKLRQVLEQCCPQLDDDQVEQLIQAWLGGQQQPDQDLADKHSELVDKNPNGGPGGRALPSQPAQAEQDPIRKMSGDAAVKHHLKQRGNRATPDGVARARRHGERSRYWRKLATDQYSNLCRDMKGGMPNRTEPVFHIVGDRIMSRSG